MKFKRCPKCGSDLTPSRTIKGGTSSFWMSCTNTFCGAMVDNFQPFTMQYNFLKDPHTIKGVFGGYGGGKSITIIKDVEKHCFITPNAYVAVIGNTYNLIERNFKKDFDENFPIRFMEASKGQKQPGYNSKERLYTLKNGAQIQLITADDTQKLRGLNATKVVLLEASNIIFEIFDSIKSRIRNNAAAIFEEDEKGNVVFVEDPKTGEMVPKIKMSWQNITLESNPENNWIKSEFLLKASRVQFYGSSYRKYDYLLNDINEDYSLHISATDGNPYLPPNYLEMNTRGKEQHEIERFYYGSFEFTENMAIPEIVNCFVDDYPIDFNNPNIFVTIGYDYGIWDPSAFTFAAWNFEKNLITVYDELGLVGASVKEIAEAFREKLAIIPDGKLLFLPQMDAKSFGKRQADGETIGKMFHDLGLIFEPAFEDPKARLTKMRALAKNGQLHIFNSLTQTKREFSGWKMQTDSKGNVIDKPVDKNNHYIDSLGFQLIKVPMNLEKAKIKDYIKPGTRIIADIGRKKPKIEYTKADQFNRAHDPLNMGYNKPTPERLEDVEQLSDDEFNEIINKLSGI